MKREEAIALAATKWWEGRDPIEVFWFQLNEDLLCMPFDEFHKAAEQALGRPVWTHEFARPDDLRAELLKDKPAPSMAQILDMIPAEKRVVLIAPRLPQPDEGECE